MIFNEINFWIGFFCAYVICCTAFIIALFAILKKEVSEAKR